MTIKRQSDIDMKRLETQYPFRFLDGLATELKSLNQYNASIEPPYLPTNPQGIRLVSPRDRLLSRPPFVVGGVY